jgi:hypothetical protein
MNVLEGILEVTVVQHLHFLRNLFVLLLDGIGCHQQMMYILEAHNDHDFVYLQECEILVYRGMVGEMSLVLTFMVGEILVQWLIQEVLISNVDK